MEEPSKEFPELSEDEIFSPHGRKHPLQGKIDLGRYYSPKNIFSCRANDFGRDDYIVQDVLMEEFTCVGFYNSQADFIKAEVLFTPTLENRILDKSDLKDAFESFGIGILKEVDHAQGIEILKEEMIDEATFFAAISVERMAVLIASNGKYMSSTRGYLIFQEGDKLVLLSNQKVTIPGQKHDPKTHIEMLKKDLLEFRKTFELNLTPSLSRNFRGHVYQKTS